MTSVDADSDLTVESEGLQSLEMIVLHADCAVPEEVLETAEHNLNCVLVG